MAIFESPSDDLVDLARAAGYDPRKFYEGTLSGEQINNLLLDKTEREEQDLSIPVTGDLGAATAFFPDEFRTLTAPVRVFADEMALQEAYYNDDLDQDLIAVLLSPAGGERQLHHIAHMTPIPELMHRRGRNVVVLADLTVTDLRSSIPVVANFLETGARGGGIGQLSDGDIVTLNSTPATIKVVENADLETRKHRSLTIGSGRRFLNMDNRGVTQEFEQAFERYVAEQVRTLADMDIALHSSEIKGAVSYHLRAFSNFCFSIRDVLTSASSRFDLGKIHSLTTSYDHLTNLLESCVRVAKRAGSFRIALRGSSLVFEFLSLQGLEQNNIWSSRFVRNHMEKGSLHSAIGEIDGAISEYRHALTILDEHDRPAWIDKPITASRVKHKLGGLYEKLEEFDEALHFYREAGRDAAVASQAKRSSRVAVDLGARAAVANAELRYRLGDIVEAIETCNEAIRILGVANSTRPTSTISGRLAAAFSIKADMLFNVKESAGGVLSRIAAIHFRQAQAHQSRTFRQSHVDNFVTEVNRLRDDLSSVGEGIHLMDEDRAVVDAAREAVGGLGDGKDFSKWLQRVEMLKAGAWEHLPDMITEGRFYFE